MTIKKKTDPTVTTSTSLILPDDLIAEVDKIDITMPAHLKLKTQEDYDKAGLMLNHIQKIIKLTDTKRKEMTQPLNATTRKINALFAPTLTQLADWKTYINNAMIDWIDLQDKKALKAAAKAEQNGQVLPQPISPVAAPGTRLVSKWTHEVTDISILPREFIIMTIDHAALDLFAQLHHDNRPQRGVTFFETTSIVPTGR